MAILRARFLNEAKILASLEDDREKRPEDAGALLQRFEAAKAGVGQITAESDTGTWVGQGEAGVRDELKPLRAKIAEAVAAHGRIPSHEREGLVALARERYRQLLMQERTDGN